MSERPMSRIGAGRERVTGWMVERRVSMARVRGLASAGDARGLRCLTLGACRVVKKEAAQLSPIAQTCYWNQGRNIDTLHFQSQVVSRFRLNDLLRAALLVLS